MSAAVDARLLNWRFVVPNEPNGLLLLPADTETLPGAVVPERGAFGPARLGRRYPAVAVPDLAAWTPPGRRAASGLLSTLAAAVAPGGWLCVGFPNRWYPAAPLRTGSISLGAALGVIRQAGLAGPDVYAALPDQRRAAYLVPLDRPAEMDHMLRVLFETSYPATGRAAVAGRRILSAARRMALAAPRTRRRLLPAYYLVARKPK